MLAVDLEEYEGKKNRERHGETDLTEIPKDPCKLLSAKAKEGKKLYRKRLPKKSRASLKRSRSGSIITVEDGWSALLIYLVFRISTLIRIPLSHHSSNILEEMEINLKVSVASGMVFILYSFRGPMKYSR